jgi:hypothetical protein
LKQLFSYFLVIAILSQSASRFALVINYQLNKSSITKSFCENKTKPKLHCNGKCHLAKQLKKQEKNESQSSSNSSEKQEFQLISETNQTTKIMLEEVALFYVIHNQKCFYSKCLLGVFRPPQIA